MDVSPAALVGTWQLRRRLRDGNATGSVRGSLTLRVDGEQIRWDEAGSLAWGGQQLAVTRTYLVRRSGSGWWVHFADGRPFHPWTPGEPVTHPCRADLYCGLVRVDGPARWRILWDVTGPTKAQRIVSVLTR